MWLIARHAYKEVAKELFISIKTVETHMSSAVRASSSSSRHELSRWASDRRLLWSQSARVGASARQREIAVLSRHQVTSIDRHPGSCAAVSP